MPRKQSSKKHSVVPPSAATAAKRESESKLAKALSATTPIQAVAGKGITDAHTPAEVTPVIAETPAVQAEVAAPVAIETLATTTITVDTITADTTEITSLIDALRDASADIGCDAAISLGQHGTAAVEPLIEALRNSDGFFHSVVRAAAAQSLGRLNDDRAVEPLLDAVQDPMAEPSAEAIRALAVLGDARAVSPLIEVARNSSGFYVPMVRHAAILALGQLGGAAATAALDEIADDSFEAPAIRDAASQAHR